jgi:DNA polymerase elongation subunit (family B)
LKDFNNLLGNHFNQQHILCGHNAKEFDIPFLARRMIINQIALPEKLIRQETMGNSASGYAGIMEVWGLQALHFFKINVQVLYTFPKVTSMVVK